MTVLDLFAGMGGWSVACARLGLPEVGIESDGTVCATRAAAGHRTIRADVATFPIGHVTEITGLIASPPCPDWSSAGNGSRRNGTTGWLIDQPLRVAELLRPAWVCCEQVPNALGVWKAHAHRYRELGYSAWAGLVRSEQHRVPQTRERAILIARLHGPAVPPTPTHQRYRPGQPARAEDTLTGTILPWVSMAEALGYPPRTWTVRTGMNSMRHSRDVADMVPYERSIIDPAPTLVTNVGRAWTLNPGRRDSRPNRPVRPADQPSPTIVFGHDAAAWRWERPATTVTGDPRVGWPGHHDTHRRSLSAEHGAVRVSVADALILQGFPADYPVQGSRTAQFRQIGDAFPPPVAQAIIATVAEDPS